MRSVAASQRSEQVRSPELGPLIERISSQVFGQGRLVELTLAAYFSRGHLLLEGPPGAGKTSLAKSLASSFGGTFRRIQMTSDLLPSDLIGVLRLKPGSTEFEFRQGPLFAHFVLADELNRSSPKTQGALLEALAEQTVTVDGQSYPLPRPFFLIATQNPFESFGVYPLAESQLDRFSMLLEMNYPDASAELAVYEKPLASGSTELKPLLSLQRALEIQAQVDQIHVETSLIHYVHELVRRSRSLMGVSVGVSVRGGLQWIHSARGLAWVRGRDYVVPQDLQDTAVPVLAHRLSFLAGEKSRMERAQLIEELLSKVPPPR